MSKDTKENGNMEMCVVVKVCVWHGKKRNSERKNGVKFCLKEEYDNYLISLSMSFA